MVNLDMESIFAGTKEIIKRTAVTHQMVPLMALMEPQFLTSSSDLVIRT